jgi:RNA polymerase sigma-70 factor (ECF subfamily)
VSEPEEKSLRRAPAPRKKVEVRLTTNQAEKLRLLWHEHSGPLHAMLVGWCGDPQNASDVLQEVFRRLAGSPGLMAKMNNARAFLAVSARRVAVDFARRGATRVAYHTAAGAEAPASENPGPTDESLRAVIAEALNGLPAEQRSVFEHKILNGRTLDEIAKQEGVSLNTVASRLRYALDKIRGQLRPYYDDLNRKDFKNMKNDPSNTEDIASQRIITPLAPKRVPSVAPGLEGLAAMAPDACEAAPEIAVSAPEFVEAAPAAELAEPEIAFCGVGGNAWEQGVPEAVELPAEDGGGAPDGEFVGDDIAVTNELPEMVTCEIFPWDGEIPDEWLRPISVVDLPEDFLVNLFEGEGELVGEEGAPYELESGFEICVLPVPEEFYAGFDPNELLARYEEFLSQDPTWLSGLAEGQGDWFHEQVTTASGYFEKLEFGTPGEANAFDHWFHSNIMAAADGTGEEGADYGDEQPDYADGSWSFDPKDLLVRYEDFLRENPDWGILDPDMMEIQVVTPSSYFGELEFGTPSKAAAFDGWYEANYAQSDSGGAGTIDGSGLVLDGSSDFDGETVVTGGEVIRGESSDGAGLNEGTSLVLSGGGSFTGGTVLSGGVITDLRNGLTGVPAEWMRSGTANTDGLVLSGEGVLNSSGLVLGGSGTSQGGGVPTLGEASQTVVTGGTLVTNDPVEQVGDNTLALSNGSKVVLEGGDVVSEGKVYAYNSEFGSGSLLGPETQLGTVDLPAEIAIVGDAIAEATSPFGNVAAGLAPTPGEALIVEFAVLSPSEPLQAPQMQTVLHATDELPQSVVASSGGSTGTGDADAALSAALDDATPDSALPHVAASAQEPAPASNTGIKVDAPTAAAGAVAAGTVVHGGAAAAPAIRRPLPTP